LRRVRPRAKARYFVRSPAKPACEAETYSKLGEGAVAGKNGIFDISSVIEAPLTLILSLRFAGGEERKEAQ
jgi:hypothetical protein